VRHHRSDAYSVELVLLNKRQTYGGAPKLHWYLSFYVTNCVLSVFNNENDDDDDESIISITLPELA